jgi:xylan 1,4-beta-xylosidase
MVSAMGRTDAVAYWTISDHFEELGRPSALIHGGFGLLSVGNLRKPRWWALWMLEKLLPHRVAVAVDGDGAGDMVNAVASTDADGRVSIVVWNATVDVTKANGDPLLDREVDVIIDELAAVSYRVRHRRLDEEHSNLTARWVRIAGGRAWPDEDEWRSLQEDDDLDDLEPVRIVEPRAGTIELRFPLPMPGISLIELVPQ